MLFSGRGEAPIPRYFFHLRHGKELVRDEHGDELPNSDSAYLQAFAAAQELWTIMLSRRDDPTAYSFEVVDDNGRLLFLLPLVEILEVSRKGRKKIAPHEVRAALDRSREVNHTLVQKNRVLQQSLLREIDLTRGSVDRAYELLRALRERE